MKLGDEVATEDHTHMPGPTVLARLEAVKVALKTTRATKPLKLEDLAVLIYALTELVIADLEARAGNN